MFHEGINKIEGYEEAKGLIIETVLNAAVVSHEIASVSDELSRQDELLNSMTKEFLLMQYI